MRLATLRKSGEQSGNSSYGGSLDDKPFASMKSTGPQYGDRLKYNLQQRIEARRVKFPIFTIDELVVNTTLAFAHIDVEGAEEEVLKGGIKTIFRDRPIFTVERFPQSRAQFYRSMMQLLKLISYQAYEIPESCGADDCRNYLALPAEKDIYVPRECSCITC